MIDETNAVPDPEREDDPLVDSYDLNARQQADEAFWAELPPEDP